MTGAAGVARATDYQSQPSTTLAQLTRWLHRDPTRLWHSVAILAFTILVGFGITTSSVGIELLQFDSEPSEEILIGTPRAIRSDEWMRNTPLRLGIMRTGEDDYLTPLTTAGGLLTGIQEGLLSPLVFFESSVARLGPILPDRQLFALLWWLPYLFTALGVPVILRFLGVRPWIAVVSTLLILMSPTISWWSLVAPTSVGLTAACGAFLVIAFRSARRRDSRIRTRVSVLAATVSSAIVLARLALSYPPWTVPLALLILLPLGIALLMRGRTGLVLLTGFGLLAGAIFAEVVLSNLDSYQSLASTTYPGARRSNAGGVALDYGLGAFFAGYELATEGPIAGINQSELATGYTILPLAALFAAGALRPRFTTEAKPFFWSALASFTVLGLWTVLPIPNFGGGIPLLNLLPAHRVAQVLGIGGMLLFGLVLEQLVSNRRGLASLTAVGLALLMGMIAVGFYLRTPFLPGLRLREVAFVSAIIALGVTAMLYRRTYALAGTVLVVGFATFLSVPANPVMVGLGDLRGSDFESTRVMLKTAARDGLLASDHMLINAFTEAAGLESLSGEQAAPSDQWLVLDPQRHYEDVWNRGAMLVFSWDESLDELVMATPQPDVVVISASPCDPRLARLGLKAVISSYPLTAGCLEEAGSFTWAFTFRYVYSIRSVPAASPSAVGDP